MTDVLKLATVEQFQIRLGRDVLDHELPRVEAILEDTTAIALGATGACWTPDTVPADVVAVLLSSALRTFKNPDRYIQQAIGDFSARVDKDEFAAGVFSKAELDILSRNSTDSDFQHGSFGTMTTYRDEVWGRRVRYWETNLRGDTPIPYSYEEGY